MMNPPLAKPVRSEEETPVAQRVLALIVVVILGVTFLEAVFDGLLKVHDRFRTNNVPRKIHYN